MKKGIAFLLVLIMLAALAFPCCLDEGCTEKTELKTSQSPCDDEGTCSPFFACATCSGFVTLACTPVMAEPPVQLPVHYERIRRSATSSFYTRFFQPPRA